MDADTAYASFLLRIWRVTAGGSSAKDGRWECEVESVQSGKTWRVASLAALLALLKEQVDGDDDDGLDGTAVSTP